MLVAVTMLLVVPARMQAQTFESENANRQEAANDTFIALDSDQPLQENPMKSDGNEVSVTIKMPTYKKLTMSDLRDVTTTPLRTSTDENGDLVLWYNKGTVVTIGYPRFYTDQAAHLRLISHTNPINDDCQFARRWWNNNMEEVRASDGSFGINEHTTVYSIWNFDVPRYEFIPWYATERTRTRDVNDESYYRRVRFEYDSDKVDFAVMPDSYEKQTIDGGEIFKYLVEGEPLFFKVIGKNGNYVSGIKLSFRNPETGQTVAGPFDWLQWVATTDQSDEYPKSYMHTRAYIYNNTDWDGIYEFGVWSYTYPIEPVITIETKPALKLKFQITDMGQTPTTLTHHGNQNDLNNLRPGDVVWVNAKYYKGYIIDYGQISNYNGLFKTNGERYDEGMFVSGVGLTNAAFKITMGEDDLVLNLRVEPDPTKNFPIYFDYSYEDELDSYVNKTSAIGRYYSYEVEWDPYETRTITEGCVGEEVRIGQENKADWAKVKSIIVESTDPNVEFSEDVTNSMYFTMPNAPVRVKVVFGLNTEGGYRKADLEFGGTEHPNDHDATAYFKWEAEGANSKDTYAFDQYATKRIVKVGDDVKVSFNYKVNNYSDPTDREVIYTHRLTAFCEQSGILRREVSPGDWFTVPNSDGDITVRAEVLWGYRIYSNSIGSDENDPYATSKPSRNPVPAETPVTITQQVKDTYPELGETCDVVFNRYYYNRYTGEIGELTMWDIPQDFTFFMPERDILIYASELYYMDAIVNVIGQGTANLHAPQRGPVRTDGIVKVREKDRVRVETIPQAGHRLKRVWLEWSDDVPENVLEVPAPTEVDENGYFTVPHFRPQNNSYKRQMNVIVNVEFEDDPSSSDVAVTITEAGLADDGKYYATMYYGTQALTVPADVTAYTYKVDNGILTISQCYESGAVIPAGQAVVLQSPETGTYTFVKSDESGVADAFSMLYGFDEGGTDDAPGYLYYILSRPRQTPAYGTGVAFWWQVENGTSVNSAAHKAYLKVPLSMASGAKGFGFDGNATSIITISTTDDTGSWCTLNGQQLEYRPTQKGIYLYNGRKVVVR